MHQSYDFHRRLSHCHCRAHATWEKKAEGVYWFTLEIVNGFWWSRGRKNLSFQSTTDPASTLVSLKYPIPGVKRRLVSLVLGGWSSDKEHDELVTETRGKVTNDAKGKRKKQLSVWGRKRSIQFTSSLVTMQGGFNRTNKKFIPKKGISQLNLGN